MALGVVDEANTTAEVDEIIRRSEHARVEITKIAPEIDRTAKAQAGMDLAWEAGIHRLSLPMKYGGLSNGSPMFQFEAAAKAALNITAGDGTCGQMIVTQMMELRLLYPRDGGDLCEEALQAIAASYARGDTRIVASNAQTGVGKTPPLAKRVPGGLVVNGTKSFNTQSDGHGWAHVSCALVEGGGPKGMVQVLIPLDDAGVRRHHDWDNMGQNASESQTITYENVFVPDGWHHPFHLAAVGPEFLAFAMMLHAIILLGVGEGAYDAELAYVRTLDRSTWPKFTSAKEDVLMQNRIGDHLTRLAAARALLLSVARALEHSTPDTDLRALGVRALAAKVAAVEASTFVSSDLFELAGARATSNKYRLDRFWRNARTFASHDPTDAKRVMIGLSELTGESPFAAFMELIRRMLSPDAAGAHTSQKTS